MGSTRMPQRSERKYCYFNEEWVDFNFYLMNGKTPVGHTCDNSIKCDARKCTYTTRFPCPDKDRKDYTNSIYEGVNNKTS